MGYHLLTFDVAVRQEGNIIASVCREDNGEILFAKTDLISSVSPNLKEASAALMAISEVALYEPAKITLEADSRVTIQAINQSLPIQEWILSPIISDIQYHLNSFKA